MFYLHHKGIKNQETRCSGFGCRPQVDVFLGCTLQSHFLVATLPLPLACHVAHEVARWPQNPLFFLWQLLSLTFNSGCYHWGCMWTHYTWDRVQKCRVEPEWKLFLMSPPVSASLLLWLFWPQGRQSWDKCPPVLLLLPFFNGYTSYPTSFLSFFVPQNLTLGISLVINLQFNF